MTARRLTLDQAAAAAGLPVSTVKGYLQSRLVIVQGPGTGYAMGYTADHAVAFAVLAALTAAGFQRKHVVELAESTMDGRDTVESVRGPVTISMDVRPIRAAVLSRIGGIQ